METRTYEKLSDTSYKTVVTNVVETVTALDDLISARDAALCSLENGKASNAAWEAQMQSNIDAQDAQIDSIRALGIKTVTEVKQKEVEAEIASMSETLVPAAETPVVAE